jgi:hypothetical protein
MRVLAVGSVREIELFLKWKKANLVTFPDVGFK